MSQLIEKLKASEQNDAGMFEIDEDTICAVMKILQALSVAYDWSEARAVVRNNDITFPVDAAQTAVNNYRLKLLE